MKKNNKKTLKRVSYDAEFKRQAVALAEDLGSIKEAANSLGIKNSQTLAAWARESTKISSNSTYSELLEAKEEIKKLKRESEKDKKVIAILKDAAIFFCQDQKK